MNVLGEKWFGRKINIKFEIEKDKSENNSQGGYGWSKRLVTMFHKGYLMLDKTIGMNK